MTNLNGKTALITGASAGIGAALVTTLAREGLNLALVARSAERLEKNAEQARALGVKAVAIPADVTVAADRTRLLQEAEAALGPIDILVNNAGVEEIVAFADQSEDSIRHTIEVNLMATLLLTRAVLPGMLARGYGHIVQMSSIAAKAGAPYGAVYSATKAALQIHAQGLHAELDGTGVAISTILPGFVGQAGMFARFGMKAPSWMGETTPEKVAEGVVKALKTGKFQVVVNPMPLGASFVLSALWPALITPISKRMGVLDMQRRIVTENKGRDWWKS